MMMILYELKQNAYNKEGGIAVLHGNVALDGAVIKQSALSDDMMVLQRPCKGLRE